MLTSGTQPRDPLARPRVAYILAASHSGSTLLAMLLGAHPEIGTVGELKATSLGDVERYLCSCGALLLQCPFWRGIEADMRERGFAFDIRAAGTDVRRGAGWYARTLLRPLYRGPVLERARDLALSLSPGWRAHLERVQRTDHALLASLAARMRRRVIVDSSKIGLRLKYLLSNPEIDVRVVRLIRDGRAVALTYMEPHAFADARDPRLRAGGTGEAPRERRMSMEAAAREWRRSNEEAENILRRLPPEVYVQLSYEEMCADPRRALAPVFERLGVSPAEAKLDFRSVESHVIGNGMRLDSTSEIRLDERWREVLTPAELAAFDRTAGALNRCLGYG